MLSCQAKTIFQIHSKFWRPSHLKNTRKTTEVTHCTVFPLVLESVKAGSWWISILIGGHDYETKGESYTAGLSVHRRRCAAHKLRDLLPLNVHHGQPEDGVAIHLISTVCELISSSPNELMWLCLCPWCCFYSSFRTQLSYHFPLTTALPRGTQVFPPLFFIINLRTCCWNLSWSLECSSRAEALNTIHLWLSII